MSNAAKSIALLLAITFVGAASAQSTLEWPTGEFQAYPLDSGQVQNLERGAVVVYDEIVTVKDAAWMRLYFNQVELGEGSYIRMTSEYDNEVQELDAYEVEMWNYSSAYFNGDTVHLELVAASGTTGNHVALDRVAVQIVAGGLRGPCADDDCGICGSDDRVLSNENWSGRLMPVGCSGSVYNTDSCVVSAGHCAEGGWADTIQFNVPASSSNCYPHNPPVDDQFPIVSYLYNSNGVGDDWAVMTTGTNGQGQLPYGRYGLYMPIAPTYASPGDSAAVWGFGVDNNNPTRSQDQQTSTGSIGGRNSVRYLYDVDVTYGNSGSALIHDSEIIGIVTHCSFSCSNVATRIDNQDFVDAREQLCSQACPVTFNSQPTPSQTVCDGDWVQLSVDVEDAILMEFQWRVGGSDLVDDGFHIFGATSDTLSIVDFSIADEASDYYCVVTNTFEACSVDSDFAEVLLDENTPVITQQPQSQTVTEGELAIFSVTVENATLMDFQWRMDGSPLSDGGRISGATSATLGIVPVELGDAGGYDCVITYQWGAQCSTTSDTATLTVDPAGDDCPEDLNGDDTIGLEDLSELLAAFNTCTGDAGYNPDADFDDSGCVDLSDLSQLLAVFNQDCPTR